MGALRPGTGGASGRGVGSSATRSLPPAAGTTSVRPEAGRAAATDWRDGARGQDRPESDGCGAQRRVRARVCRLLVRREARAQRTSSAGGAGSWSDEQADRVGARRRSPQLLRIAGPGEAGGIRRTADWGRARGAADQALVGRGRAGRWEVDAQWDGDRARREHLAVVGQRVPALRVRRVDPAVAQDGSTG